MQWSLLESDITSFAERLEAVLQELGVLEYCQGLRIDHAGLRLQENTQVDALREEMQVYGKIISAVNVNGREIGIFQLTRPLQVGQWQVYGVELPYPKPNHHYPDGWEHVEFVLENAENTMESVRNSFLPIFSHIPLATLREKYSYSEDEPHAEGDQIPNPTISLKVNGIGIKFHAQSIQEVVGFMQRTQ